MVEISVTTHARDTKTYCLIEARLAQFYFRQFERCIDCALIVAINGLTGEVVGEYRDGKLTVWDWESVED